MTLDEINLNAVEGEKLWFRVERPDGRVAFRFGTLAQIIERTSTRNVTSILCGGRARTASEADRAELKYNNYAVYPDDFIPKPL